MKMKFWRGVSMVIMLAFYSQFSLYLGCSSNQQQAQGDQLEANAGEADAQAAAAPEDGNSPQEEGASSPQAAEGQAVANDAPTNGNAVAEEGNINAVENQAVEEQSSEVAQDAEGGANLAGQQSDLQEIINGMNSEGAAQAAPVADAGGQAVPADAASEAQTVASAQTEQATPPMAAPDAAAVPTAGPAPAAVPVPAAEAVAAASQPLATQSSGAPVVSRLPEAGSKMAYIVQKGESLASIATKIYGDMNKWKEIADFTGLVNPSRIYPGDVVYYQLTEKTTSFANVYETVQKSEVEVQQGDTLFSIAGKVLGDSSDWRSIWRQNDKIDNPDKLTVGTKIYYISSKAVADAVKEINTKIAEIKSEKSLNNVYGVNNLAKQTKMITKGKKVAKNSRTILSV